MTSLITLLDVTDHISSGWHQTVDSTVPNFTSSWSAMVAFWLFFIWKIWRFTVRLLQSMLWRSRMAKCQVFQKKKKKKKHDQPCIILGGSGIKKKGGGNDTSMHSAMFDSARVRGALRCYDTIDRVEDRAVVFLARSSLWVKSERSRKRQRLCSFIFLQYQSQFR